MSEKISKTARASVKAGDGSKSRPIVAWVMKRRAGRMEKRPYASFSSLDEAREFYATCDPEAAILVTWEDRKSTTKR